MWKITAGRGNIAVKRFLEKDVAAIGFSAAGDYTDVATREALIERYAAASVGDPRRSVQVRAAQAWRFMHEVAIGDRIVTYDPDERVYHLGIVAGAVAYQPDRVEGLPVARNVKWEGKVSRDDLSVETRNSLGAILTIFKVPALAAAEIEQLAAKGDRTIIVPPEQDAVESELDPFADIADQALERIKDRILALEWDEMQELVAALLRALGYRTIISPTGSDRGRDIIASRDGFGFEAPRIVVEVKHRRGPMGAPEVRAFLGGRHSEDRGLYVSTGGFTREAQYEAERAATVTHLMTIDGLARALVEQYEQLDEKGRRLLPLTKVYWPAPND